MRELIDVLMASFGLMLIASLGWNALTRDTLIGIRVLAAMLAVGTTWALIPVLHKKWLNMLAHSRAKQQ